MVDRCWPQAAFSNVLIFDRNWPKAPVEPALEDTD